MNGNGGALRLVPLLNVIADADDIDGASSWLLRLCIDKAIPTYVAVPLGHVIFEYSHASIRPPSAITAFLGGYQKPMASHATRPILRRAISYLRLGNFNLEQIRDARVAVEDQFFDGGLIAQNEGLRAYPFKYGVASMGRFPHIEDGQRIADAQVKANGLTIRLSDIHISSEDAIELRRRLEPEDKHQLKGRADGVYLLYWAAFKYANTNPYNDQGIGSFLMEKDESNVFTSPVVNVAINMIKKDLSNTRGKPSPQELRTDLIEKNQFGKNYREPFLSDRMCLILYATDCWLHDDEIQRASAERIEKCENEINGNKRLDNKEKGKQIDEIREKEISFIKSNLHMPDGLREHLSEIGFLDKGNMTQAMHLVSIITNYRGGGRHAGTEKEILKNSKAAARKSAGLA